MRKSISLILISLFFLSAYSQNFWKHIETPDTVQVKSVFVASNGYVFFGDNDYIYRSIDNCTTWQLNLLNNQLNISFTENTENLIVSNSLYYSNNFGDSWQYYENDELTIAGSVFFNHQNYLFAGNWEYIYKITPNFQAITVVCSSNGASINDFAETSNGYLYAVAWDYMNYLENGVYRSTDGGDNWDFIDIADDGFTSIVVNSNDEIFAASYYDGLFMSDDYGDTWNYIEVNTINDIFIDSNDVIYIASDYTGVHRSLDNGETWEDIRSGLGNTAHQFAIAPDGYLYCRGGYSLFRTKQPITTFINEISSEQNINIYPNPATDIVNINFPLNINNIKIFNSLGQLIDIIQPLNNKIQYSVNHLTNGIYFIKFFNNNQIITKKIIVKH